MSSECRMLWPFLQNSQIVVSSLCGIVTFSISMGGINPHGRQFTQPLLGLCELVHIWPFAFSNILVKKQCTRRATLCSGDQPYRQLTNRRSSTGTDLT